MPQLTSIRRLVPQKIKRFLLGISPRAFLLTAYDRVCGKRIILFHLSLAGQSVYILPILKQLRKKQAKVSVYLITDQDLDMANTALSKLVGITKSRIFRWNACASFCNIDAFITPTQWIPGQLNATVRVCIFHGQPTKGNTFLPEMIRYFNALFLLGPLQRSLYDEFAGTNPEIAASIRTFRVGYPKSDDLINGQFSKRDILTKLGLDPARPVVLYAPAFDKGTALDMYGEQVVEKLLEVDASILVKLHPMCYDPRYYPGGINWTERLRKFEKNPCFKHIGNQPLDPYLAASDVLVTDTSGSGFEFMLLDKPVVFIDCADFFKDTLGKTGYVRTGVEILCDIRANAGRNAGIVIPNPSQLPNAISRSLKYPDEYSPKRQAVRAQMLYNPGKAAIAAVDTLLDLVFEK